MAQVNDINDVTPELPEEAVIASPSPWQPLRQPVFRMLWIATVMSNIGSWMNDVGVNWTMLTLSADPLSVALVQAASSLPMFLFALPSGVMADIIDRRKYLLFSQLWVFIAATGLTILSFTGHITPLILLIAAFLLSAGAAMSSPPFQAIVPDLVKKDELGPAIALNSLGINISRAIGPALGGLILSFAGPWMVFMLNAISVLGVAWVLYHRKAEPSVQRLPPEHFSQQYVRDCVMSMQLRYCGTYWCGPSPSSFLAAPVGLCYRWWRGASLAWGQVDTASCWRVSASAPFSGRFYCRECVKA